MQLQPRSYTEKFQNIPAVAYLGPRYRLFQPMKRAFLYTLSALAILTSASSCVREYTCQCTITYTGQPGLPEPVHREYPLRDTKGNARDLCKGNSQKPKQQGGITTEEVCDLY